MASGPTTSFQVRIPRLSSVVRGINQLYVVLNAARPLVFPFFDAAERTAYDALLGALKSFIDLAPYGRSPTP